VNPFKLPAVVLATAGGCVPVSTKSGKHIEPNTLLGISATQSLIAGGGIRTSRTSDYCRSLSQLSCTRIFKIVLQRQIPEPLKKQFLRILAGHPLYHPQPCGRRVNSVNDPPVKNARHQCNALNGTRCPVAFVNVQ
jgi:hypothetical protein